MSWRIGREVVRARKENRIDSVAESIIDAVGGPETGRVLFKGKIVGVERTLRMGHIYGEVIIEGDCPNIGPVLKRELELTTLPKKRKLKQPKMSETKSTVPKRQKPRKQLVK